MRRPRTTTASASVVDSLNAGADENFARAYEPYPFEFPRDHGPHPQYKTEWWYYTGNVEDENGEPYGYQLTFFRSALTPDMPERTSDWATNQVYMAHFAVTDAAAGIHESFERYSRGDDALAGAQGEPSYAVWLEDWFAREVEPGVMHLQAEAPGENDPVAIDLILRATRPVVLHGDRGLSQKGPEPGNANYYYSLVGLETTGTITRGDEPIPVTGMSWMDHEFGTSALSGDAVGWDWFSVQLDNGAALMAAQVRTASGGTVDDFEGTLVTAAGEPITIGADDFTVDALDEWTSPHTGITYPSGWRITIPAQDMMLIIEPLLRDQEMQVGFVYWEGAIEAQGELRGESVSGVGYVELTGYGVDESDASRYQR